MLLPPCLPSARTVVESSGRVVLAPRVLELSYIYDSTVLTTLLGNHHLAPPGIASASAYACLCCRYYIQSFSIHILPRPGSWISRPSLRVLERCLAVTACILYYSTVSDRVVEAWTRVFNSVLCNISPPSSFFPDSVAVGHRFRHRTRIDQLPFAASSYYNYQTGGGPGWRHPGLPFEEGPALKPRCSRTCRDMAHWFKFSDSTTTRSPSSPTKSPTTNASAFFSINSPSPRAASQDSKPSSAESSRNTSISPPQHDPKDTMQTSEPINIATNSRNSSSPLSQAHLQANNYRRDTDSRTPVIMMGDTPYESTAGAQPISMRNPHRDSTRPRRESLAASLVDRMSWGGISVGSWVRDE